LGVIAPAPERLTRNVLSSPARLQLPNVAELDTLWTLALLVRANKPARSATYDVTRAEPAELPSIVAFLNEHGRRRQFFQAYTEHDFLPGAPLTLGFDVRDFFLARRDGRLLGVIGVWDRSDFKHTIVQAYRAPVDRAKQVYDLSARFF